MRKFVITPRAGGKTHAMLAWMRENDGRDGVKVAICHDERYARRLQRENPDIESWRFVGPTNIQSLRGRHPEPRIAVDNVELLLAQFLGRVPEFITGTDDDWPVLRDTSDAGCAGKSL